MKAIIYIFALSALLLTSCKSQISSISLIDYNEELTTEWNDGKLWAYCNDSNYVVGMAMGTPKDDIGVDQMYILIKNKTDETITFDPSLINIQIAKGTEAKRLETYRYPFRQNKYMSLYNEGENIYLMKKMTNADDNVEQIGYMQKNTIPGKQGIVGYLNFEKNENGFMIVDIPVENKYYSFQWYVGQKPLQQQEAETYGTLLNYQGNVESKTNNGKTWAYKKNDDYIVGITLSIAEYDTDVYKLDMYIENLTGDSIVFNPNKITATLASGREVTPLDVYGNPLVIYSGNNQNVKKLPNIHDGKINIKRVGYMSPTVIFDKQGIVGFINIKKDWRHSTGILVIDIPVGDESYQFQWDLSGAQN